MGRTFSTDFVVAIVEGAGAMKNPIFRAVIRTRDRHVKPSDKSRNRKYEYDKCLKGLPTVDERRT